MNEKREFLDACWEKLENLKKEEAFLKELLRDVQKQIGKYKVEALYLSHVNIAGEENGNDEKVDEDDCLTNILKSDNHDADCAEIINQNQLNLELRIETEHEESDDESEESDVSD